MNLLYRRLWNDTLKIGELSDYVKFVRHCLTNLSGVIYGRNKIKYIIRRFNFKY